MAQQKRSGKITEAVNTVSALAGTAKAAGDSFGNASKQFREGLGGVGPKDEGNYNEVLASILALDGGKEIVQELDSWMASLEKFERSWFIRVIANMVTDAVQAASTQNKPIDMPEVCQSAALVISNLINTYDDPKERKQAALARGLLKEHKAREWVAKKKEEHKEAGEILLKYLKGE